MGLQELQGHPQTSRQPELHSNRARGDPLGVSLSLLECPTLLHQDLNFHHYQIAVVQQLLQQDFARRVNFAETMLQTLNEDPGMIILTSDEAHFHLNGCVNKQNFRYWSPNNPQELHERPLHSEKVTVWAAVCKTTVIGPYFFQENGRTVTENSER